MIDEWIKKMWYIHTQRDISHNKNEIMPFIKRRMDKEIMDLEIVDFDSMPLLAVSRISLSHPRDPLDLLVM